MMIENHAQACDDGNNNTGEKKMNMLNATLAFFFFEQMMAKSLKTTNIIKRDKKR